MPRGLRKRAPRPKRGKVRRRPGASATPAYAPSSIAGMKKQRKRPGGSGYAPAAIAGMKKQPKKGR